MMNTAQNLREVREVVHVSHCNCLREVTAGGARVVRHVIAQVIDFIAGGCPGFAGTRSLYINIYRAAPLGSSRPVINSGFAQPVTGSSADIAAVRLA